MKFFLSLLLFLFFSVFAMIKSSDAASDIKPLGYEELFEPQEGQTYQFKDFILVYQGISKMSLWERWRKFIAMQKGIDGGEAMNGPSMRFEVTTPAHEVFNLKLLMVPYSVKQWQIGDQRFQIDSRNDTRLMVSKVPSGIKSSIE